MPDDPDIVFCSKLCRHNPTDPSESSPRAPLASYPRTYQAWGDGGGGYFIKRIVSGHLSISVTVRLSLRHIYYEFGENRHIYIGDIK